MTQGRTTKGPIEYGVMRVLDGFPVGEITIVTPDGRELTATGARPGPSGRLEMHSPKTWRRFVSRGANGFADAYLAGEWDSPDLGALLDWGAANVAAKPDNIPTLMQPFMYAAHRLRDNSLRGSKKNIEAHYDLGNDFYRLWLDPTMTYSSALFGEDVRSSAVCGRPKADEDELVGAQVSKWDRLLDQLQPGPKDHLLEIGCGWGGFAIHAAKQSGCKITGITLSSEQHAWATELVKREGLEDRIELRLQDYRVVPEQFTGIASIEMFEAVGERWWPVFFGKLKELLPAGRRVALQTITVDDRHWAGYRLRPEFTQEHIFPGGMLPCPSEFKRVAETAGFLVEEPQAFGYSYARTLEAWRERFESALPQVRSLGFDERFVRLWRYYLEYCRACFDAGTVSVMQVTLEA